MKALIFLLALAPLAAHAEWVVPLDPLKDAREASYFDKQNEFAMAGGAACFVMTRQFDSRNREVFAHQRRIGDLETIGNEFLGTGAPGVLIDGGLWYIGEHRNLPYHAHAGIAGLEALTVTTLATTVLKVSTQRERPDGSDFYSFPSGHTSSIAATAMSLQEFYGWKLGVPAFALTLVTAAGRWSSDKHWLSDTIGGAALGIYFGHAFSQAHLKRGLNSQVTGDSNSSLRPRSWHLYPVPVEGGGELIALISI